MASSVKPACRSGRKADSSADHDTTFACAENRFWRRTRPRRCGGHSEGGTTCAAAS
jgi:hypothetical protein